MSVHIREFEPGDYDAALALWSAAEGVVLRDADTREAIERYLARNPGTSFVAVDGARVVGTVLAGHDGRRGFVHHLTVAPTHRRHGVGRALAERAIAALDALGIRKCHLMVLPENTGARAFWAASGWHERPDVVLMSYAPIDAPNA